MTNSGTDPQDSPDRATPPVGGGVKFILIASVVMCLLSWKYFYDAVSWTGGHDAASMGYLVLGLPSLLLQLIFAPFIYGAFRPRGRDVAIAALIPVLLSVAMAAIYFVVDF